MEQLRLHFETGPSMGVLYDERLRELRTMTEADFPAWAERVREHLAPSYEYITRWQEYQLKEEKFRQQSMAVQVDEWLWRSPQPRRGLGIEELRARGVTAICNLREESRESERYCHELGLAYHYIPVPDMSVPRLSQVQEFLDIFLGTTRCLVHCWAGQGRTGLFVACYRIARGMEAEEAVALTDKEIRARGMRPHQRQWVLERAHLLPRFQ